MQRHMHRAVTAGDSEHALIEHLLPKGWRSCDRKSVCQAKHVKLRDVSDLLLMLFVAGQCCSTYESLQDHCCKEMLSRHWLRPATGS
jgi:hypothetical protein